MGIQLQQTGIDFAVLINPQFANNQESKSVKSVQTVFSNGNQMFIGSPVVIRISGKYG